MRATLHELWPDDHTEEVREEWARGGKRTAFSLETPAGWRTLDSPYEPRGEAERVLARAQVAEEDEVLLLGCGSGFFAKELLKRGVRSALLVTAVRQAAERSMKRLEQEGMEGERLTFAGGVDARRLWDEVVTSWLEDHPEAKLVVHPREAAALPGFYGALQLRWERRLRGRRAAARSDAAPRRLLLPGVEGLLERELADRFRARGWQVDTVPALQGRALRSGEALDLLERHRPDLLFSTNHLGADPAGLLPEACELEGVPWGTWLLDDPRFILGPEERMGAGQGRVAFCWDRNGMEAWRELGFDHAEALPLATDPELFRPGPGFDELSGRVVFVGSPRFARAEGYFHALDRSEEARAAAETLEEEILRTRRAPSPKRAGEVLAGLGFAGTLDPEGLRRLPAYAVQQANRRYRTRVLEALAPLRPLVFGEGWEGLLPPEVEVRPPVDYYRDLPRIYASDAVHISMTNLQMRSWPNQRAFDVGACGRVVLLDRLEGLGELFGDTADGLVWDDTEQLVERARRLAVRADLRARLGEALRGVVLREHTIGHRVDRILSRLHPD